MVPPHEYFVCGDNTMNSYDSRYWGAFPEDRVVGKFAFVFCKKINEFTQFFVIFCYFKVLITKGTNVLEFF